MERQNFLMCYTSTHTLEPKGTYSGYGVFGFILEPNGKKRSQNYPGKGDYKYTYDGIIRKKLAKDHDAECIACIDIIGGMKDAQANPNTTELEAIRNVLEYGLKDELVKDVLIVCNNNYMEKCFKQGFEHWRKNDWKAKNGHTINNKEIWIKIDEILKSYESLGMSYEIRTELPLKNGKKIFINPGHLATAIYAVMGCKHVQVSTEPHLLYNTSTVKEFKDQVGDRDIIFDYKQVVSHTNDIGDEDILFLASPPKSIDDIGKRILENSYALLVNDTPTYINDAKKFFRELDRMHHVNFKINLNTLKGDKIIFRLFKMIDFPKLVSHDRIEDIDYYWLDSKENRFIENLNRYYPFVLEVRETRQAMIRACQHFESLKGDASMIDITDLLVSGGDFILNSKTKFINISDRINLPNHKLVSVAKLWLNKELPLRTTMKNFFDMSDSYNAYVLVDTTRDNNLATMFFFIEYTVDDRKCLFCHLGILDRFLVENI